MRARARARPAPPWPPGWVGPFWLERQRSAGCEESANVTQRNWTAAGNLDSSERAVVDGCGLITPEVNGWSLDWWIGAEDRWHFPSREVAVRQSLLELAPVVQTAMHVPGGDMIQRVYGVRGEEPCREFVVVEVENQSALPVAVGFAVRPVNCDGPAPITQITVPANGPVSVDGRPAILLPRPPSLVAFGSAACGDVSARLATLQRFDGAASSVHCAAGQANAVLVFPLAHRALLRVALLFEGSGPERSRRRMAPSTFPRLASAAAVARGWAVHSRRGMSLTLPEGRLADAVEANRRAVLLCSRFVAQTPTALVPALNVAGSLDRYGFHDEAVYVLRSCLDRRRINGAFRSGNEAEATAQMLHGMAEHWRLTRDDDFRSSTEAVVGLSGRWLSRRPRIGLWSDLGQRAVEELGSGMPLTRAPSRAALPAEAADSFSALAAFAASLSMGLIEAGDPRVTAAVEAIGGQGVGDGPLGGTDRPDRPDRRYALSAAQTAQFARVEVRRGDRRALHRLQWLVDTASSTFTWPEVIDPFTGAGCAGGGDDLVARSAFLTLVRDLLVRELPGEGALTRLALCSMLPEPWVGQPVEVRHAPTAAGLLSFALRWHGSRPALMWELVAHDGLAGVRVTAPGLDPEWSSDDACGEALFGLAGVRPR